MLHHRLGLHEGRRYWLSGLPHIRDGEAKCHLPCKPKHLQLPLHGPTPRARPDPAGDTNPGKAGVTTISCPTAVHCTPPFGYTPALLQPSQAFYVPAPVLPIPVAAAPAALLQCKDHPDIISIWSAELPDKLHTKGTCLCLLCWGGTRPDPLSQGRSLGSKAAETPLLLLTCSAPS